MGKEPEMEIRRHGSVMVMFSASASQDYIERFCETFKGLEKVTFPDREVSNLHREDPPQFAGLYAKKMPAEHVAAQEESMKKYVLAQKEPGSLRFVVGTTYNAYQSVQ